MADGTDPVSLEEQRRQAADRLFAQEMADEDQRKAFRQQSWDMTQPPPDQAGEALQLGNKFGVPRKAVEADPDYWKRRDQEARRKLLMEASPRTMAWLDDEDNYAVAKDDVDILSQIESTFSKIGYAAKGGFQRFAAVGVAGERQSIGETMEFYRQRDEWEARQERRKKLGQDAPRGWRTVRVPDVGTISGFDIPISYGNLDTAPVASGIVREEVRKALPESMRPMFASQVGIDDAKAVRGVLERRMATVDARARAKVEEFTETLEKAQTGNYVADGLLSGVTSLTEMAPSMAAFFALRGRGGATVASGAMGVQVAGAEYLEGIYNLNLSERDASDRALLQAGVEIVTERISLGYLDELLKSDRGFVSKLALSMGQEQIQEQFATLGNRLVDIPYVDQDMTIGRFVEETPYYAGQTALATLVASGITNTTLIGLDTAVRDMVERSLLSQPSAGDAAIDAVLKKAKESRLGKRSPEKLKDVLDRQAAGTGVETVTVDLDELAQALKEKGVELSDALDGLGVPRDELQQKWENFGEIEVKLSDLATSDLMRLHGAETQANTRRNDDPYTPARKEKMRAALEPEMQETAKRIYDDLQNGADMAEKEQQVADRVRARIRGAGILAEREQENASVAIQTAMVTTLARRIGIDPVEFYDQHYPRIQGSIDGMVAEEGALEQGSLEPGPAPMMLTRGMRLGGPDIIQPDETTGFITSAEQAFNRPAGRFEKAKALTEEQWIKYFQIAGTTKEAMERQVYPALAELAGPDNDRSEITREQMREALMGNRVNVEFASERDYSAYVADGRYSGYEQEVIVLPDEAEGYQSHNWQTDGVVAHIRYTQRRGADGKNILHVEELQSDLHQEAAKQGYRNKNSEKYARLRQEEDAAVESYQETVSAFAAQNGLTMRQANQMAEEQSIPGIALLWKDWESATKARQDFEKEFGTPTNIPDAPMKDWESALIRRALQKAASIGVEVVTFPKFETLNGALQNAGTRKFYDERLPATIARVAKQLGLKVEQVGVSITDKDFQALDTRIRRLEKQLLIGKAKDAPPKNEQAIQTELSQLFKQRETALSAADNKHIGIRLTPEASARLAAGNVLFQTLDQQRRGQFSPSRNIITMFEAADVTTLMHEGAHWYLAEIERMAMAENAHPFVTEQWEAVKKWGKVGPDFRMYDDMGRVTPEGRELQEAFAETFEVYLQTGKAPVPSLREAFRAFKQWITALWRDIRTGKIRLPERANLSPEITRVMDRMLAVDEEIESQTAEVVTKAEAMANDLYDRGIITKRQRDAAIMNLEQAREAAKEDLMAQIMQAELRVREAQLSAEQRRIKGDVTREYDRSTVGRAVSWLGYGTWKGDVPVSETEGLDSEVEFYQSIRTATRMPMEDIYAWVVNNVDSKIQQFSSGDEGTMMSWRLSDAPDAPRVLLSIRLSRKGRADVNLFLNNKMADALDEISDPVERSRIATEMFSQAIMVMRQYSAETPDLKAFNFIAAENEKAGRKAKSREELYRFMLSTMRMDGYTAYEIGSQTSVVRQADGVKSADPLFDGAGFVMIRDGVDVDEFARNEILRGSQSGGDAGEVVTALTAVRLSRPARGGVDRGRLEAGRADPGGAVDDTLGQEARKVDTSVAGGLTEKSFIRTRDLEGATIFPMFADLTDAGSTFAALDGLPIAPTPYLGGPNFPWLKSYRDAGIVWAFNAPNVITKVRNKVRALQEQARAEGRSDRVVITMLAMKDDAHTSNEMTITALLRTLDAVVAAGRFPQEQLAEAKELIVSKANKKDEGYSELATFPGFGDAQALHDWSRGATFAGRKALAKEMRSAKFQQLPGMFPVERIVREAIDPDYRATQQGDALLAFEIDPDADDLIIDFENKDQAGDVPRHPAYRYGMRGTLVGSFSTHIPMEVLYADLLPAVVGRSDPRADPMYLMKLLRTGDAQVITEDIVREAEVIEGLHDYRIAQAHTAGIAGQWRSSDAAANKGGVNPVEFERALLENEAAATLTPYTRTDVTKGKKDGSLRVFQLGEARVQDGGLNVWMAVKTGYDYRNEYPGEVTDALVEQGILTDNEVALVGVASNELGVKGMATFQVLKGIEEGVTVLDAFKVTSPSKPDGLLPTIYATLGFEEVGQIPFDPTKKDAQQLADLKAIWTRQGWSEADGYPAVAIMKWRGDDAVRPEATRRFILESQEGLGIGSTPDVAAIEASTESVRDSDGQSDQGNGLPGQGDGRADPRRFADRARGVSSTVRSYVENILAADARAIKALKLPQELIDRIRAEYGPALEQTPDDTLGQEAAPTFYSALGRFIASSNTARAPAAQWKGMISNAPGVKAEEVEWSGVMDWLDASEGPVTREALAQFVEANGVRVEEVALGGGGLSDETQRKLLPLIEERDRVSREFDAVSGEFSSREKNERLEVLSDRLSVLANEIDMLQRNVRASDTKFSSWTLPGGENYREMLLTLPVKPTGNMVSPNGAVFTAEELADPVVARTAGRVGLVPEDAGFRSSHWSEPNVLAHVRFKERTGPNGERVLALEEVQSDWHQAGRERGYKGSEPLNFEGWYAGNGTELFGMPFEIMPAKSQEMARIRYERYRAEFGNTAVPNAPFKNNAWANLVLKRMIRYAAENGFDAVAWIPGNVQNGQIVEDTGDNRGDFYDKIVPNLASKLGKKYGARVTDMVMEGAAPPAKSEYFVEGDEEDGYTVQDANNRRTVADGFRYEEDAFAWIGENEPSPDVTFHSLPLTPELAAAAMTEGFPLFQRGDPKGWGETAPPPDLPPMRLDLEAVRELYGEDAVRRLPKPIRDRSRDKTSIDGMMDIIRANVKTLKRKPPMTLFQYIRSRKARTVAGQTVPIKKWGIKGAADELKAMNREDLINETNGIHIDYVRESAAEAGYLPEDATLNDFLNAIDREARGEPVYSRFDQKEVEDQRFAKEWADWLDSQGVDMFEANQKKLKAEIAKIVTSTAADARTPDEIAAKLGFADGETMLNMLALMGNRDQYVKEETDRRMREEFGDPMADGTFEEEARVIAEAEVMSRAAEIEMEALARAVGEPAASKLAKEMAMDSLGLMTVKELEGWERFLNAERREMNNTLEAVKRGDMVQAFIHKRRQLVNMHLARAAREKSIAIEKTRKDLLTYYSSKGRRDKIAPDYLEKIEALLEGYELRVSKQGPGEQKRRMSAKEYVDDMDAQGREDQVAPEARLLAELSDKKVWRTLTADEVDYVAGTVRNIAHLGRTKDKLMRAQEKRRFQAVIGALVDRMNETGKLPGVTRERSPTRTASELAVDMLREGHSWLMRPEHQARSLDGAELGPVWEALFRPMAEAADVETQMMREATRLYREAWSKFSGAERNAMSKRTVSVPELPAIGKRFTQLDIISIALNWGVTYNREVLLEGYGWTADQVEAALFRTMTDKHWDLVESLWAISGMYKAEAFALEKAMTGVEPKAVEGISFTLPSGRKIDGKYYHIQYDANQPGKMSRRQAKDNDAEALTAHRKSRSKAMTKNGGLIERKGSGGRKVKLGLSVFEKAMSETIHDIAFRRAVFDVGRIIADDNFADTYQEVAGMEAYRQLNVWLKDIAMPPMEVLDPIVKAFAHVRRNIPLAVMGYKVGTALIQPTGLLAAMPLVGHRRVLFAVAKAFANPKGSMYATWKQVADMSEFMRDRVAGYERDVRETTTAMTKGGGLDFIRRNAFAFITGIDIAVSVPTWMAAYGKAMDGKVKGIQAGVEGDAVAYADSIIRRTQTAGKTQDLSRFQRGGEFQKQISMIFGYFNNLYSLSAQQTLDMRRGNISRAEWAWHMSVLFVAIPLLAEVFAGRLFPDDEDDEETIEGKIAETVLLNFTGMFPGLRDAVALNVKPEFGYRLSPTSKFIEDIGRTAGLPAQLALDDERELKEADVRRAVNAVGALTGLPSAQINITGNYIIDALQGEEDPTEDPVDAAREALVRNTR